MTIISATTMAQCTVQLWYNKQRVKKNGNVSLYLQIIMGNDHPVVPLKKIEWPAKYFDWNKKVLLPRFANDPDILTYNAMIETERAKYWNVIKRFMITDTQFTVSDIFREVNLYKSGHKFCEFMENAIRARQKTTVKKDMIKESTAGTHRASLAWFKNFLNHCDIDIMQVNDDLLERFANYLRREMTENSVWVKVQNIKSYLSYAFRNRIPVNLDYKRCIVTAEESDPVWLDEYELDAMLKLYFSNELGSADQRNLRAFLFACSTGLRISDLSRFNKSWIKNGHIEFYPVKRKKSVRKIKPLIIPILPLTWEFINSLKNETFEIPKDQVYNRGLKILAEKAGINKNLTSHVARHTFATSMVIDGVETAAISKLLGHKNMATTNIYVHIGRQFLAEQMMKMNSRFGEKRLNELKKNRKGLQ